MPASVPSVFQSSSPFPAGPNVWRMKNIVSPTAVKSVGAAGGSVATVCVPASVPSLIQTRTKPSPAVAANMTRVPKAARSCGKLVLKPVLMSRTKWVPAVVPSLVQSSAPCVSSTARKKSRLPATIISSIAEPCGPGSMSRTSTVPSRVPSLFHSSSPMASVVAWKYATPPRLRMSSGSESAAPGAMSRTRCGSGCGAGLGAATPTVTGVHAAGGTQLASVQSCTPCVPSSAVKKSALPTRVSSRGDEPPFDARSATSDVPGNVPVVRQSSSPWVPSSASK